MKFENGFWVMTSAEYDAWMVEYDRIMSDPNSSDELLMMAEQFTEAIAIDNSI